MVDNFELWKEALLQNYKIFMYGDDGEGKHAVKFCDLVYEVDGRATEMEADLLFSLFTDNDDYGVLESVISQLEDTKDKKLFVNCLLKAFPRLASEAQNWATAFFYIIQKDEILERIRASNDNNGKQAIIDYIYKYIKSLKPTARHLTNENAMKYYLDNIEEVKNLAKEIENSMR